MIPNGWIDPQVNGYEGVDFSRAGLTVEDVRRVARALAARGTAAFCPTVCSAAPEVYRHNLPVFAAALRDDELRPHLLGVHLEGPFLAAPARGAHPAEHLRMPDIGLIERWQELAEGNIRLLTLAPELDGAPTIIRRAIELDMRVGLGHHMADAAAIDRAVEAGATFCTHLGNGIPNTLPRHPNPIWTQLADDRLTATFITDGHHLPPEFIRVALRAKGVGRFVVTSDASPLAGLPPGRYPALGGESVVEAGGRIHTADGATLAGSSATMADCMGVLAGLNLLSPSELECVGRTDALQLLGIESDR